MSSMDGWVGYMSESWEVRPKKSRKLAHHCRRGTSGDTRRIPLWMLQKVVVVGGVAVCQRDSPTFPARTAEAEIRLEPGPKEIKIAKI